MIGASARERQEAEMLVFFWRTRGPDPRGACTASSMALNCEFEKGGSAGQIGGFDPRVSPKQLTGHYYSLTREVTRISRVMT